MSSAPPLRVVLLGTGTNVGKTYVGARLLEAWAQRGPCLGLKPVESGVDLSAPGSSPSDAQRLTLAAGFPESASGPLPRPGVALPEPISPHLASRRAGIPIELDAVAAWVRESERAWVRESERAWVRESERASGRQLGRFGSPPVTGFAPASSSGPENHTLHVMPLGPPRDRRPSDEARAALSLIETAGGAFSPLTDRETCVDLARRLEPAVWILVAPDALGVLHDVRSTLLALAAVARPPDLVALSAAREPDASLGSNAHELEQVVFPCLGAAAPRWRQVFVVERNRDVPASLFDLLRVGPTAGFP